jgi:hypothetical protein
MYDDFEKDSHIIPMDMMFFSDLCIYDTEETLIMTLNGKVLLEVYKDEDFEPDDFFELV